MEYEQFLALGLLPENDPAAAGQPVGAPANRDALSEAHQLQLMLGLMSMAEPDDLHPFGNYRVNGVDHYGVLPNVLTAEGAFAGHVTREALTAPPPLSEASYADFNPDGPDDVLTYLGLDAAPAEPEPPADPFYDPSGVSRDPDMDLFAGGLPAPYVEPQGANPEFGGFTPDTISSLEDVLGPDVSSVARLGGPFAGYSPDQLTARLRDLVRRA